MESDIIQEAMKLKREMFHMEIRKKEKRDIFERKRVISSEINASSSQFKNPNIAEPLQSACSLILTSKKEENLDKLKEGIRLLSHIFISESKEIPVKMTINTGVCEALVGFIKDISFMSSCHEVFVCALQIIVDLLSGDLQDVLVLVHLRVIEPLMDILRVSSSEEVQRMVLLALFNITLENIDEIRKEILTDAFIDLIIDFVKRGPRFHLLVETLSVIHNITFEKLYIIKLKRLLPVLCAFLHYDDSKILLKTLLCFSNLTSSKDDLIETLFSCNVTDLIISIADSHSNSEIREEALRVICNVLSGENIRTEKLLSEGLLKMFYKFLKDEKTPEKLIELIAWGVTNLMCCPVAVIDKVLKDQIVLMFYPVFFTRGAKVKSEYLRGLKYFSQYCNYDQVIKYGEYGNLFRTLVEALDTPDEKVVRSALKATRNCLELGREIEIVTEENPILARLDKYNFGAVLDRLQIDCQNAKIVEIVQTIIAEYFMPSSDL